MEEIWFSKPKSGAKEDSQNADLVSKTNLSNLAGVIMTVTGTATGDRPPPVDDLLRQVSIFPPLVLASPVDFDRNRSLRNISRRERNHRFVDCRRLRNV